MPSSAISTRAASAVPSRVSDAVERDLDQGRVSDAVERDLDQARVSSVLAGGRYPPARPGATASWQPSDCKCDRWGGTPGFRRRRAARPLPPCFGRVPGILAAKEIAGLQRLTPEHRAEGTR
jgi:hypothetical protein